MIMSAPKHDPLLEKGLRRPLTSTEWAELQAYWAKHPERQTALDEEVVLTQLLHRLPAVPVSSNFAARVLQAVESDQRQAARRHSAWMKPWLPSLRWVRALAWAGGTVGLLLFSTYSYQAYDRREMARSVAAVSGVTALPAPEVLQDFDTIQRFGQTPPVVDDELLAALK
jgi:hypothetical protein